MQTDLVVRLKGGEIIIADGATGTALMAAGLPPGMPPELWNVEQAEQIRKLHRSYLDAGSQIILTNTFGGNRIKLGAAGFGERVSELNHAGSKLARDAAGQRAFVAGDIGPTGELMAPLGKLTSERAIEVFAEQAQALAQGGVDLLWIETMMDIDEARSAVIGARQATDLPIFCSLSFGPKGYTMMGVSARQAAEQLWPLGLTAIGANCGEGIDVVEQVLTQMHAALPNAPLIAKPNAGRPQLVNGQTIYDMKAADFSARMSDFVALGARVLGACCGSDPTHIAAISSIWGTAS